MFKACVDEDFVIDVLHQLNGKPVDADMIASAEELDVLAIRMRVLSPTQVITEKLNSLNEHHCDFAALLPAIRAVREQVDWDRVRAQTAENDFAVAFLVLTDRLGITDDVATVAGHCHTRLTICRFVADLLSAVGPQFISCSAGSCG